MAVELPEVDIVEFTPRLISTRSENNPELGTSDQRFPRMGSRYALDVKLQPLSYEAAQEFADLDDETGEVAYPIPQIGFDTGAPGSAITVDGSGQSGSVLSLKGLTPQYLFRKNQWISVVTGGRRYCYRVRTATVASAGGTAALPLRTMLRKPHINGDAVEVARPLMEGYVTIPDDAWRMDGDLHVHLSFSLKERA